jgi:hypothetical protein
VSLYFYYFGAKKAAMKKIYSLLFLLGSAISGITNAQSTDKCGYMNVMQKMELNYPGYMQGSANLFNQFYSSNNSRAISDTFLYVRVVVHVVYNTPQENLDDSVVFNQIKVLNDDFGRMNADTVNMRPILAPIAGIDSRIRFVLANIDPQGNPTNGITRTSTTKTTFFSLAGGGLAEDVKSTANGGIDPWDQSRYLNIWVCDMSIPFLGPAVLGYATPPSGLPNWDAGSTAGISDGVVIQYQVFGANNPNPLNVGGTAYAVKGRTPVHEVGHYLGLRHIWGDETNCVGNDGIADTPRATDASAQDCDATKNTCVDTIAGIDMPDMIENYMDYSAEDCQNSFTMDQAQFVRWVIRGFRPDVATVSFVGMEDDFALQTVSLAPNPAAQSVIITNKSSKQINALRLFNLSGQLLLSEQVNNTRAMIDVSAFADGIYFVELTAETAVKRLKLIVQH